jgi:hypothetical protein
VARQKPEELFHIRCLLFDTFVLLWLTASWRDSQLLTLHRHSIS